MINKIVILLLTLRNQIKIYHWQTKLYARHKASDMLVEKIDELLDKYVETYQGLHPNLILDDKNNNIDLMNIDDMKITAYLQTIRELFITEIRDIKESELLNIRDDILQIIDQTLYLFKLE